MKKEEAEREVKTRRISVASKSGEKKFHLVLYGVDRAANFYYFFVVMLFEDYLVV